MANTRRSLDQKVHHSPDVIDDYYGGCMSKDTGVTAILQKETDLSGLFINSIDAFAHH